MPLIAAEMRLSNADDFKFSALRLAFSFFTAANFFKKFSLTATDALCLGLFGAFNILSFAMISNF
jgi:hypothetical protein